MSHRSALTALKWGFGALVVALVAGGVAARYCAEPRGTFSEALARLPDAEQRGLAGAPALAIANATWALGSVDSVKKMVRTELDRLPESENLSRARVLIRWGIIDSNPDGQAAVFSLACQADPQSCDHLKDAAERETRARFVAPGNTLPLSLIGGHPEVPSQR